MPGLYRDRAVVVRTVKLGDADRIVTLLTQGHGKVRAVAKGVRKTTSRFGARLEPTSHVSLQCYRGRDLDVVTQVETIDAFRTVRERYAPLTHAVTMLETVDQVAPEREPVPAIYRMLVGALRTLAEHPSPLVAPAFLWKLLSLEGFHPALEACVRCDDGAVPLPVFHVGHGGVLCGPCGREGGRPVSPEALDLLRRIVGGRVHEALAEPIGPGVGEVERLAVAAVEHHLERRLRSAALL